MWVRAGRRFMQSQKLNGVDVVGFTVSEPQSALRMQQESGCRKSGWTGSLLKDRLLPGLDVSVMSRSCVTQYSSSSDFYLLIQKYNPIIRVSAAQGHGLQASLGVPGRQGRGDTLPYRRLRASEPTGRGGLSEREGRTTVSKHAPEFQASDACPSLALSRALGKETSSPGMEPG